MISAIALLFLFWGSALGHHPQAIGQDCNYSRDCHPYIDGGPAGYDNIVTCAIHQDQNPECKKDGGFGGICKWVGTLEFSEFACPCGVHHGGPGDCFADQPWITWTQNPVPKPPGP